MAKKQTNLDALRPFCEATAAQMGLEFCDVLMEKEPQGRYLRFYVDKEGGLSLDDCERFHHAVQPKAEAIDYDFMEVCSPGLDRPVKTELDIRKARSPPRALVRDRSAGFRPCCFHRIIPRPCRSRNFREALARQI